MRGTDAHQVQAAQQPGALGNFRDKGATRMRFMCDVSTSVWEPPGTCPASPPWVGGPHVLEGHSTATWHPFTTLWAAGALKTSEPKPQTSPFPKLCLFGSYTLPAGRSHSQAFIYSRIISSAFYELSPIHTLIFR